MRGLRWGLIITMTTNTHIATHAIPVSVPKMGKQAMVKRGPLAWENYDKFLLRPLGQGGFPRLLTHAVGDSTAAQWLPKVKDSCCTAGEVRCRWRPPHKWTKL